MQIIGFNFEKIQATRKNEVKRKDQKLKIASNILIKSINQEKLDIMKDQSTLKFNFGFSIDYKKNIAEISLEGFVLMLIDKNKAKEILKKWKTKKIEDNIRIPLFNFILTKSNLKALQLEEELNLPTHIPLPRIRPQGLDQGNTGYMG